MRRVMQGPLNPQRVATQAEQEAATSASVFVAPSVQHSHPGSAKAVVVFNGTTGAITPLFAYNVTVVTPNAAGDFTVKFITPFSTCGYAVTFFAEQTAASRPSESCIFSGAMLTSSCRIRTIDNGGTPTNYNNTSFVFFGDQ